MALLLNIFRLPIMNMMNRTFCLKYFLLAFLALLSSMAVSQVKVEEKPVPPEVEMEIPPSPGPGYFLMPGSWTWHKPSGMYIWLGPVWVLPPEGKTWQPGHWRRVNNGWIWVPGKWKRETSLLTCTKKKVRSADQTR
jgi:hypothetical protein